MTVGTPGHAWRKSSYSSTETNCVEVACNGNNSQFRDTKARDSGSVAVTPHAWHSLSQHLQRRTQ